MSGWSCTLLPVPVGFLGADQQAAYGRFCGVLSLAELARFFLLDDADRKVVATRRSVPNRLGYAVQLCTVRFLGTFVDVADVPVEGVEFVADQLGCAAAVVGSYGKRPQTVLEHQWEIRRVLGYVDFAESEVELREFLAARTWIRRERPSELFDRAVVWLRERRVLLPGVTTLTRLIAEVRRSADERMYSLIADRIPGEVADRLDGLLTVDAETRLSTLERLRRAPTKASGRQLVLALQRVEELRAVGAHHMNLDAVPAARVEALASYGLATDVSTLRRLATVRKVSTLTAAARALLTAAIDDAVDVFAVVMSERLIRPAERASDRQRLRLWDELADASTTLASTGRALLELIADTDDPHDPLDPATAWQRLRSVVHPERLATAVGIAATAAPATDRDRHAGARAVDRYATVALFCRVFAEVIPLGTTTTAARVLAALRSLGRVIDHGRRQDVIDEVVTGSWRPLVYPPDGGFDHRAYVLCVLEAVYRGLRRRELFVIGSRKWADPRSQLISPSTWTRERGTVLKALQLTGGARRHLEALAGRLDAAYQHLAEQLGDQDQHAVRVDVDGSGRGRLRVEQLAAVPEPASLVELARLVGRMLPRVDLPDVLMEVHAWTGCFDDFHHHALADQTRGSRIEDLAVSLAAVFIAEGCNLGYTPVVVPGVPALTRDRLSHVNQNYVRAETITAANARLIDAQAAVPTAQTWGGGLVASVDGLRFVVPVRTLDAGPNPRYFGQRRGVTWLNAINDQVAGIGATVVTGTMRDSLHVLDVILNRDGGPQPEMVITDTASYSDIVFGLFRLLSYQFSPRLADLPDQRLWRLTPPGRPRTDSGSLRVHHLSGRRIVEQWDDMLRVAASLHTGAVSSHDLIRMLSRDGNPTPLGAAIADYGRVAKTLHILAMTDVDDTRRRVVSHQLNLQEGRHRIGRKIFFGRRGQLRQPYRVGQEDQLGVLGLVLNAVVLWNTVYIDAALNELGRQGRPIDDSDIARLSPLIDEHLNVHGHYAFTAATGTELRPLRDPSNTDDD